MLFHNFYRAALVGLLLATLATLPIHNTVQASPIGLIDSSLAMCDMDGVFQQNRAQSSPQLPTTQQALLRVSDVNRVDRFGRAVAISNDGNTVLASGTGSDEIINGYYNMSGIAYFFTRNDRTWSRRTKLILDDAFGGDNFGSSVALSADGNTALIGADHKDNSDETIDSGAAYIYTRSGNDWSFQAKITANDQVPGDYFGHAVALSADGNMALIGATGRDEVGTTDNGAAYVFVRTGTTWVQQGKLVAADKADLDTFGHAVALSADGTTALIGTYNYPNATDRGAFYTFVRNGTNWTQQSRVRPVWATASFAYSLALSSDGGTALIGSLNSSVFVFIRAGANWVQQTQLPIENSVNGVSSVALSGDGNTLLVGAYMSHSCWTEPQVLVYTRNASVWTYRTHYDTQFWGNGYDYSFTPFGLSRDGETAIVGGLSIYGDGAVSVYAPPEIPPTATPTMTSTPIGYQTDTVGVYKGGIFYLRNTNTTGAADIVTVFGGVSDLPVVGDWNGDGIDTLGVYRPSTGFFFLSDTNTTPALTNYSVLFGNPGDKPFAGRWTADMTGSGIGVYRDSNGILYQRKSLTSGVDDFFAVFGNPGDQAVAGDWDGNGFDSIGIYRSSNQTWYLTNNSSPSGITFSDISFTWDIATGLPVVGDWDGDHVSTVGYLSPSAGFVLHPANATTGTDNVFWLFSPADVKPIAGKWIGLSKPPVSNVIHPIVGATGNNSNDNGRTD